MTQDQKAKAYDKAKYIMTEYLKSGNAGVIAENTIKNAFPELKESEEDERIMEEIISAVNIYCTEYLRGDKVRKDMIAWLRKHADKVEPKFKVGDWIIYKDDIWKISNISLGAYYELLKVDGEVIIRHFEGVDKTAHLWTVKDAKEGDVLFYRENVKYSDGIKFDRICLFKNLDNAFFTLTKNYVEEYDIDVNIDYPNNTVPATKEQKEILFMVMKEAGYTFDFEKKELKKIEQKHTPKHKVGDTIYYNSFGEVKSMIVANVVTDSTDNPMYEDENGNAVFEKDLVEQKPIEWSGEDLPEFESYLCLMFQKFRTKGVCTNGEIVDFVREHSQKLKDTLCHVWSEEDEEHLNSIISDIKTDMGAYPRSQEVIDIYNDEISFLKSLKERVQPKQEWSKEDEEYFNSIAHALSVLLVGPSFDEINLGHTAWFKSLKDRYTWKPSDEQLNSLKQAINAFPYETDYLELLYNDLKKLKGEL